jgi:hypothetical protein
MGPKKNKFITPEKGEHFLQRAKNKYPVGTIFYNAEKRTYAVLAEYITHPRCEINIRLDCFGINLKGFPPKWAGYWTLPELMSYKTKSNQWIIL